MCCYKDQDVINECNTAFDANGEAIFYKVIKIYTYRKIVQSIHGKYIWKSGVNEAVREDEEYDIIKPRGFHVYLTKYDAKEALENLEVYRLSSVHYQIVKVVCEKQHFIRAGSCSPDICVSKQAVFSHLTITQQEWNENVKPHFFAAKGI